MSHTICCCLWLSQIWYQVFTKQAGSLLFLIGLSYRSFSFLKKNILCYLFNFFFLFFFFLLQGVLVAVGRLFSSCSKRGLLPSCSPRASHHRGLFCWGAQDLGHVGSIVVAVRLQSTDSVLVEGRLSCSEAHGIFTDQGSNQPMFPRPRGQILYHWTTSEALRLCFIYLNFHLCFSFMLLNF